MRRTWTPTVLAVAFLLVAQFLVVVSRAETTSDVIPCTTGLEIDYETEENVEFDPNSDVSFAAKDTKSIEEAIEKLDSRIFGSNSGAKPTANIKEVPEIVKPTSSGSTSPSKNEQKKARKSKGSRRKGAKRNKPKDQKSEEKSSSSIDSLSSPSSTSASTGPTGTQESPANSQGRNRGSKKNKNNNNKKKNDDKSKNSTQKKPKIALKRECKKCLKGAVTLVGRLWKESEKDYQQTASEVCSRLQNEKTRQECVETFKTSYLANDKFSTMFYCKSQCPPDVKLDDLPAKFHPPLKVPKVKLLSWKKIQKKLEKERKQREKNQKKNKDKKKPLTVDDTASPVGLPASTGSFPGLSDNFQPIRDPVTTSGGPGRSFPTTATDDDDGDFDSSAAGTSRFQPSYRDEEQQNHQSRLRDAADSMDPDEREGFCSWCVSTMTQGVKQKKDEAMDAICKCQNCFDVFGGNMDPKAALCTVGTNVAAIPTQYATSISGLLGVCTPTCAGIKIWQTAIGGLGKLIFRDTV